MAGKKGRSGKYPRIRKVRNPRPEWTRTPDTMKDVVDGDLYYREKDGRQMQKMRKRKTKVTVDEPIMSMMDEIMELECVSGRRLEKALGLGKDYVKDMRRNKNFWKALRVARQALWAMGFDLEIRLRRVGQPYRKLVLTEEDFWLKRLTGVLGDGTDSWKRGKLWDWLDKNVKN